MASLNQPRRGGEFLRELIGPYRGLAALGLICLLVVDVLEVAPPYLLKIAIDSVTGVGHEVSMLWLAAGFLAVSAVQAIGRWGWRAFLIRASFLAARDARQKYADQLFRLSASFFDRRRIGDLMSLATNDVDAIRMALGPGILVFADAVILLVATGGAMLAISPKLALLALATMPIIPWIVMRNEREIHRRYTLVQESYSELSAMAQEGIAGARVIKAYAREDRQLSRFAALGEKFIDLNLSLARVQSAFGPSMDFVMSLGVVLLLWIGGRYVLEGTVTLGVFVAFQRYIQKMAWPMAAFGMAVTHFQRGAASGERILSILDETSDVPPPASPALPASATPGGPWRARGEVELRELSFRFPGSTSDVLSGISLRVQPGERVAFVGVVGSGKSALLGLLPRLYPVGRGMVSLDGIDVNDWPLDELRRQIGFVSQEVFLFSGTVEENLSFGLRPAAPTETEPKWEHINEATEIAAMREDVSRLTHAMRTRIGERGITLSGGQKQRLSIARALAMRPAVLVLDDALSAVDVATEEAILRGLRARPGRNTELIAAHRISTVRDADRIAVLADGSLRQIGTHAELVADRRGAYRAFYEQQRLREDLEAFSGGGDAPQARAVGPDLRSDPDGR